MILRICIVVLLAGLPAIAYGQDRAPVEPMALPAPDQAVEAVKPVIEKTSEHTFRIGKITFDKRTREVRFPAKINMSEGLLEFLLVHDNGKIHESLLSTDISATQLNLALTLLRYQPSRELYALPSETGGLSGNFPDVPAAIRAAARLTIEIEVTRNGVTTRSNVNDWIQDAKKLSAMPAGHWVYGGSEVYDGKYIPETTGDIIAIFVSQAAMINYPGDGNQNDEIWIPFPKRVPPQGSEVTVILSPYPSKAKPSPAKPKTP